jgi:hypothetical protein
MQGTIGSPEKVAMLRSSSQSEFAANLASMKSAVLATLLVAAGPTASLAQLLLSDQLVRTRSMPRTYAASAPDYALHRFAKPDERAPAALAWLANTTRLVTYPGSPPQVVYTAPDGLVALWFPEHGETRLGRWYVEEQRWELIQDGKVARVSINSSVCFDYSGGLPNPFAPEWQRSPNCFSPDLMRRATIDRKEGDIFSLARGQPGRSLGPLNARTLADLAQRR